MPEIEKLWESCNYKDRLYWLRRAGYGDSQVCRNQCHGKCRKEIFGNDVTVASWNWCCLSDVLRNDLKYAMESK